MKKIGKAEKRAGFGDAMSNGSHNNPPYVSFEAREKRDGIYFEETGHWHVLRLI